MKRCIAYRVSPRQRNAWVRCRRAAARDADFCRQHADALQGALLGVVMHTAPERTRAGARAEAAFKEMDSCKPRWKM